MVFRDVMNAQLEDTTGTPLSISQSLSVMPDLILVLRIANGFHWNMGALPVPPAQSACYACTTLCVHCSSNFEIGTIL